MQEAEAGAQAARAADAVGALRLEVFRLAEQVASVERRNQVLEETLPAEVLGGHLDDGKIAGRGSGLSESMKLFLRKRFGAGLDGGSDGSGLGGRRVSSSTVNAVGTGTPHVHVLKVNGTKEAQHASENTRGRCITSGSSDGPGEGVRPENSGLLSERVREGTHHQLTTPTARLILSRGVAAGENSGGTTPGCSQNGEKRSDAQSSGSLPAARVFFSPWDSSTSQLLVGQSVWNREEGMGAEITRKWTGDALDEADGADAAILHPIDTQNDSKREESLKRRRMHVTILDGGARNSPTLPPSTLHDSRQSNNSKSLPSELVGGRDAESDATEPGSGRVDRVSARAAPTDSSPDFHFSAGGKEKFSDCPGKPFGYIPSVFAGSEALDKVQEEVPHLRRRASHDPSSAEPLEVTFASDLNRGPHTGSFKCALSSSEDEKEESFPGADVTSIPKSPEGAANGRRVVHRPRPRKKTRKKARSGARRTDQSPIETSTQRSGESGSDTPGRKRLAKAESEPESELERESGTSSAEEAGVVAGPRAVRKKRGAKEGRRSSRGQAAAAEGEPEAESEPERESGTSSAEEAGGAWDQGVGAGEDLISFFQESQPEEPNLRGGESLTAQHIHEVPQIPTVLRLACQGGDDQVGDEPSPTRHNPEAREICAAPAVDRPRNDRACPEAAAGTLIGHEQLETSNSFLQPTIVPDLDSFFTEGAGGITRSENASSQQESGVNGAFESAPESPAGERPDLREALSPAASSEDNGRVDILERQFAHLLASLPAATAHSSDPRVDTLERELAHIHERENAQDSNLREIGAMLTSLVRSSSAADEKVATISARIKEQESGNNYLHQASLYASSEKVKSLEQVVEASRKKDRVLKAHIQEFSALLDTLILRQSSIDTAETSRSDGLLASRAVAQALASSTRSMVASPGDGSQEEFSFGKSRGMHVSGAGVEASRSEASSESLNDLNIVEDFLKLSVNDGSPPGRAQGIVSSPSDGKSGSRPSWHEALRTEGGTLRPGTHSIRNSSVGEILQNSPPSVFAEESSAVSFFAEGIESEGEDSPIFAPKDVQISPGGKSNPFLTTAAAVGLKAAASRGRAQREKELQSAREAEVAAASPPDGASSPFLTARAAMRLKATASRKKAQRERELQSTREAAVAAASPPDGVPSPFLAAKAAIRLKAAASRKQAQREKMDRDAWEEDMAESLLQRDDIERCIKTISSVNKPSVSTVALAAAAATRLKSSVRRSEQPEFAADGGGGERALSPLITPGMLETMAVGIYSSDSDSEFEDVTVRLFKSPASGRPPARSRSRSPQRPPWYPPGGQVPN